MPRAGALLVVLAILWAGCSGSADKASTSETPEERERRTSRPGPSGGNFPPGNPRAVPAPEEELNTTVIAEFRLKIASGPYRNDGEVKELTLAGNNSTMRFTSTFFANVLMPYSGQFLRVYAAGVTQDPPTLVGQWTGNGTTIVTHALNGGRITIGATGYQQQQQLRSVVDLGQVPAPVKFSTRGWGDVYIDVVVEVVNGPAERPRQA